MATFFYVLYTLYYIVRKTIILRILPAHFHSIESFFSYFKNFFHVGKLQVRRWANVNIKNTVAFSSIFQTKYFIF